MAEGTSTDLISISRDLEAARQEIAGAVVDLERAVRRVTSTAYWKRTARETYAARPWIFLGAAILAGYAIGGRIGRHAADEC